MPKIELYALVTRAQEYISRNYATVLADKNRRQELENCIGKYLYDTAYTVEGYTPKHSPNGSLPKWRPTLS